MSSGLTFTNLLVAFSLEKVYLQFTAFAFAQAQLKEFGYRTDLDVVVTKGNGGATTVPAKCLPACEDQSMGNFQGTA